jgi:hypothetical protein
MRTVSFAIVFAGAAAFSLSACTPKGSHAAPKLEPLLWPDPITYCAFLPEGAVFDFANRDSWKFMFVTVPAPGIAVETAPGYVQIGGEKIRLMRDLKARGAGKRTWVYQSGDGVTQIELTLEKGGAEAGAATGAPQAGTIRLRAPMLGVPSPIVGGCGL